MFYNKTYFMERLTGIDGVPVAGLIDQSRQQRASREVDRGRGAPGQVVGWVWDRKPVQNSGSDVYKRMF